jgi:hypothetical protein
MINNMYAQTYPWSALNSHRPSNWGSATPSHLVYESSDGTDMICALLQGKSVTEMAGIGNSDPCISMWLHGSHE